MRAAAVVLMAACVSAAADWRAGVATSFRDMRNPYGSEAGILSRGRRLYGDYCADCHSARGSGTRFGPPLRPPRLARTKPGEVYWLLRHGLAERRMPAFSFLGDKDLWAPAAFVRQIR